jgi:hypothetical protein
MGAMLPGVPEPGELPEPEAPKSTADAQAIARIEHAERVADLRTLRRASVATCTCRRSATAKTRSAI